MNPTTKALKEIEKIIKENFAEDYIKEILRYERKKVFELKDNLDKIISTLERDITAINLSFHNKSSFFTKETLYSFIFEVKRLKLHVEDFIIHCDKIIGDENEKK